MLHKNNITKDVKMTFLGILFLILAVGGFVDCWIEYTGSCGWESKAYIAGFFAGGLGFLFLDYAEMKVYIKTLIESLLNRIKK